MPKYTVCDAASRPGRQFRAESTVTPDAAAAGSGARAWTGTVKNRTSLSPTGAATPQWLLTVSFTYFANTPPKLTVVLAAYVGRPAAWANSGTPCNSVQVLPSTEYSTLALLTPKPTMVSIIWLEFHTHIAPSL